jgi:uncharacterized protein GlcG (DUF336 family)
MNKKLRLAMFGMVAGTTMMAAASANAACSDVTRAQFVAAANTAATETNAFGFGQPMWATMVDETGKVCHVYSTNDGVANTGALAGNAAWLGSRVISAQKANTANEFSTDVRGATTLFPNGLAISTGGVYAPVQPGGSLYGLQHSNPVNAAAAYSFTDGFGVARTAADLGKATDPMKGKRVGGVNVFGGGVALYSAAGAKVGAVGASGDTSCRDHTFAYRLRINLGLNNQPNDDGLKFVAVPANLFESPLCGVNDPTTSAFNSSASDFGARP